MSKDLECVGWCWRDPGGRFVELHQHDRGLIMFSFHSGRLEGDIMAQALARQLPRLEPIILPAPRTAGGRPFLEVLATRHTTREFAARKIDLQTLSDVLWAAFGINRSDGRRTAPSARNWQEIDIYVALPEGLYLFDSKTCRLDVIHGEDIRADTGMQDFVGSLPLSLIYVADFARVEAEDSREHRFYSAVDAGFIAQNVYLFCASEGLATVVRGLIDRKSLVQKMSLRSDQRIIVAQTIGYAQHQSREGCK
jgi:hypothetical protein